jgi:YHS domain-containing protein
MKMKSVVSIAFLITSVLVVAGCQSKSSDSIASNEATADQDSHVDQDHAEETGASQSEMETMRKELASFSEEDRASAMKQHICPVSGEMLGSMGAPEKVEVNGQTVWICCDGCKDKLLAEPEKYLEKLAAAGATTPDAE